jgi:hypothetical protein
LKAAKFEFRIPPKRRNFAKNSAIFIPPFGGAECKFQNFGGIFWRFRFPSSAFDNTALPYILKYF